LIPVLVCHEAEEVSAHEVVAEVRLVLVCPVIDELIGKGVNKKSTHWDIPFGLPCPHHSTQSDKIPIAVTISVADGPDFWPGIGGTPSPTTIRIWKGKTTICMLESGHDFKRDPICECNFDNLSVCADTGMRVCLSDGLPHGLEKRRLTIPGVIVVS
jgi:hypothetical protein